MDRPTEPVIEHADKMLKKINKKVQSKLPWGHHKAFLKTLSKSHNFVTFIVSFFEFDEGVSVHLASALFSWTEGLNYWFMVKQGPKIPFNFYNNKTDTCVVHFMKIYQE